MGRGRQKRARGSRRARRGVLSYNRVPVRERAMTPNQFRKLALALPDAVEGAHGGHPDFRVGGKGFASLGYPDAALGMIKLTPDQQAMLVESTPKVFAPIRNTWGVKGYTSVRLAEA